MGRDIQEDRHVRRVLASRQFTRVLATALGFPVERVSAEIFDIGISGKLGVGISFKPELTDEERRDFARVLPIVCAACGVSTPLEVPEA